MAAMWYLLLGILFALFFRALHILAHVISFCTTGAWFTTIALVSVSRRDNSWTYQGANLRLAKTTTHASSNYPTSRALDIFASPNLLCDVRNRRL